MAKLERNMQRVLLSTAANPANQTLFISGKKILFHNYEGHISFHRVGDHCNINITMPYLAGHFQDFIMYYHLISICLSLTF